MTTHNQETPTLNQIEATDQVRVTSTLVFTRRSSNGFHVAVDVETQPKVLADASWVLVVHNRDGNGEDDVVVPLRHARRSAASMRTRVTGFLPAHQLGNPDETRWDVYVRPASGTREDTREYTVKQSRLAPSSSRSSLSAAVSTSTWRVEPYVTVRGNVSFITGPPAPDPSAPEHVRDESLRWLQWRKQQVAAATEPSFRAQQAFGVLPAPVRKQLGRFRANRPLRGQALELLKRFGVYVQPAGADTAVVSRDSNVRVTNIDRQTRLISTRKLKSGTQVYETHRALFKHMVIEHVVDLIRAYRADCVLDVGANKGQYARELRAAGYKGHIISFEPVPETYEQLERAAARDPKWTVVHCALGRADTTMPMNVVVGSMSSLLPPSDYGDHRYKRFQNIQSVDVPVRRLDELLGEILPAELQQPRLYLKMDTQGYDVEVFAGLGDRVTDVVAMQSEVALLQIYEGMPRMPQAVETFESKGFEVTGMFPVTREQPTGRVLEFDCVLARPGTLEATD